MDCCSQTGYADFLLESCALSRGTEVGHRTG
jgi:hypothetical protein